MRNLELLFSFSKESIESPKTVHISAANLAIFPVQLRDLAWPYIENCIQSAFYFGSTGAYSRVFVYHIYLCVFFANFNQSVSIFFTCIFQIMQYALLLRLQ